jgi:hypothetical protein
MRHLLHILASVAMWGLFGYYWSVVLGREQGADTVQAVVTLVVVIVVGLALTVLWIGHNVRLARKFAGRRRQPPPVDDPALARDTLGRPITAPDLDALRGARVVEVSADADRKVFRVAPAAAADEEPPA